MGNRDQVQLRTALRMLSWLTATAAMALLVPSARAAGGGTYGLLATSPNPGSSLLRPETQIGLRLAEPWDRNVPLPSIEAIGSRSGPHPGVVHLTADGRTLILAPDRPFAGGESVRVRLDPGFFWATGTAPSPATFSFSISPLERSAAALAAIAASDPLERHFASPSHSTDAPDGFPAITTITYAPPAPGSLFLATIAFDPSPRQYFRSILDNAGAPLYAEESACLDFKQQPNGLFTFFDRARGCFLAMDSSYSVVDSFKVGNGYATDLHELRLLPDGHALLMAYDAEPVDMSAVVPGGRTDAIVIGLIVQELDASKQVVFQWRSWDHFAIPDATHEDLTAPVIDYVHGNALEVDADGQLLLSCRHMDEITKIDRTTGNLIWRWGGSHNQFAFLGDTLRFSHQHAIRRLANGHYTLYDNGNFHTPNFSRAVEYDLDAVNRTARAVWQYRNSPDVYGNSMGYVQRLADGHTLISWGAASTAVTEVDAAGHKVMDVFLPPGQFTYRAYRESYVPTLAVPQRRSRSGVRLSANAPNPFSGSTALFAELAAGETPAVAVYDIQGRELVNAATAVRESATRWRLRIDLAGKSPGVYLCRLTTPGATAMQKLIHMQ